MDKSKLKLLSKQISSDIDEFCVEHFKKGFRNHLGASEIGDSCSRKLWYKFRWCKSEEFSGRMYRLFNRGHLEEFRFKKWLDGIGCNFRVDDEENNILYMNSESGYKWKDKNENVNPSEFTNVSNVTDYDTSINHVDIAKALGVTPPQYRFRAVGGHFCGSLDGMGYLAGRYQKHFGLTEKMLLEGKTQKDGSGWSLLKTKEMERTKPKHFCQNSVYGNKFSLNYCVYIAANKNNDELYIEVVKLNHNLGAQMELKAEKIIVSPKAPDKLSPQSNYYECARCDFHKICHGGGLPEKNCRSCSSCEPVNNASFKCHKVGQVIPPHVILEGCPKHEPITLN